MVEALFPKDAAASAAARGGPRELDLVLGELSPSAGPGVAALELSQARELLAPSGQALVLASGRQERERLPAALPEGATGAILVRRDGWTVLRLARGPRG